MFVLSSAAFADGARIPEPYTGDGTDISPPLQWTAPPEGTQRLALICEDPDAPKQTWSHWVLFDLPAAVQRLPEKVPPDREPSIGGKQGLNDFGNIGYGGPAPPKGHGAHRYYFTLYALDSALNLRPGAKRNEVLAAIKGHVLAECQLMGRYERR